ncbi:response regulator [Radicibacter daui]|uniref:response regulator n=1 Tax=Radicibacter daui TaxID=3064829 RepID=UPI004046C475
MTVVGISSLKLLLVEDEKYTRTLVGRLLRQYGFEHIYEAADGVAGLREMIRVRPDIVLCDIHMKPLDGMGFLQKVRAAPIEALRATPVIFLTADSDEAQVRKAREHMADGYLVKPISPAALEKRLDPIVVKVLEQYKTRQPS